MQRLIKLVFVLFVASLLAVACAPAKPSGPVEVKVTLTEFKIESSLTEFQVGVPYHFVVTNNGVVAHEVMIAPVMATGMMIMDELDAISLAKIGEDELLAGVTATMDVTFTEPAELELSCHVPGHYEAGMKLPITIVK